MSIPRATKIVATLGPASSDPAVLERMILSGVNVVRVNFSHGTSDGHTQLVNQVREVATRLGRDIAEPLGRGPRRGQRCEPCATRSVLSGEM